MAIMHNGVMYTQAAYTRQLASEKREEKKEEKKEAKLFQTFAFFIGHNHDLFHGYVSKDLGDSYKMRAINQNINSSGKIEEIVVLKEKVKFDPNRILIFDEWM